MTRRRGWAARQLKRRRVGRGWSQAVLVARLREAALARGQRVGVNAEMISRWENGHRRPESFYRILIEDLLDLPMVAWEEDGEDVERRQFLGTVGAVAAGGVAAPGATLSQLLGITAPARVDDDRLEAWRAEAEDLQATYETTAPEALVAELTPRLQQVTALLREPQAPTTRQRLSRLGAELAGLRGKLAFFHLEEGETAELWYRVALSLAEEAGEHLLAGWILGSHSLVPLYGQDHTRALGLLQRGLAATDGAPAGPTRAWLLGLNARAQAASGRTHEARQALREAEQTREAFAPGERRHPMVTGRDLNRHFHRGVALKLLGDLSVAEEALDAGLAHRPADRGYRWTTAVYRMEKADLFLRRGQPDEAAHVATTALEALPEGEAVASVTRRLARLRRGLVPFRDAAAVRRLEATWAGVGA